MLELLYRVETKKNEGQNETESLSHHKSFPEVGSDRYEGAESQLWTKGIGSPLPTLLQATSRN